MKNKDIMKLVKSKYISKDAGIYVSGDLNDTDTRIQRFVLAHGWRPVDISEKELPTSPDHPHCGELINEAIDYMEEHFPVEGHYWGFNEYCDWGLFPLNEE